MNVIQWAFAAVLGFTSIVEWAHFRRFQKNRDWGRMAATATAAIAAGYMASEALDGDWPSWEGHGYE